MKEASTCERQNATGSTHAPRGPLSPPSAGRPGASQTAMWPERFLSRLSRSAPHSAGGEAAHLRARPTASDSDARSLPPGASAHGSRGAAAGDFGRGLARALWASEGRLGPSRPSPRCPVLSWFPGATATSHHTRVASSNRIGRPGVWDRDVPRPPFFFKDSRRGRFMPLAALVAPGGPWLWRHLSPCPLWSHSRLLRVHVSLRGHSVGFGST